MKFLLKALMLCAISLPVYASGLLDNLRYGIALVNQNETLELKSGGTVASASHSSSGFALFAEKYYRKKFRFSGSLGLTSHPGNKIINATLSADYLYPIDGRTALFGGLAAGGAGQQYDGSSLTDMSMGLVYGAQLGALFYINHYLSIDLGYRLRISSLKSEVTGTSDTITATGLDELYVGFVISL